MPIAGNSFTTTVQDIVNGSSQDLRQMLGTSGTDSTILMDYTNRTQLEILRKSRWPYTRSDLNYLITEMEQTDYWIGPIGTGPAGMVDTTLNLTNVFRIDKNSVFDRSNNRQLKQVVSSPLSITLSLPDAQSRYSFPAVFRSDPINPNILQIYPAPNNINSWQPVPQSPANTVGAGGSLANRIYYVWATFVDNDGNEGTASANPAKAFIPASNLITVLAPRLPFSGTASGALYSKWNVYVSTSQNGPGQLQNASPIALGTSWTEPSTGLIAGVNPPKSSALIPMDGYLIEFRYYQSRPQLTALSTVLSIPDDYKDVVQAGVNMLAYKLADRMDDVQFWNSIYTKGIGQIIADKNLFPSGPDYISPDPMTLERPVVGDLEIQNIGN